MSLDLVVAGFIVKNDKVLLIKHKKLNKWLPVGGHIEENETPDNALRRESLEEVGLAIEFLNYPEPRRGNNREYALPFYANVHHMTQEHLHYCLFYLCTSKETEISGEYKNAHKWFSKKELGNSEIPDSVRICCLQALKLS